MIINNNSTEDPIRPARNTRQLKSLAVEHGTPKKLGMKGVGQSPHAGQPWQSPYANLMQKRTEKQSMYDISSGKSPSQNIMELLAERSSAQMQRHSSLPELVPYSETQKKQSEVDLRVNSAVQTPSDMQLLSKEPSYRLVFEKDKNYVHKFAEYSNLKKQSLDAIQPKITRSMADLGIGIRAQQDGVSLQTNEQRHEPSKYSPDATPAGLTKFRAPEGYDLESSKRNTIPLPSLNARSQSHADYKQYSQKNNGESLHNRTLAQKKKMIMLQKHSQGNSVRKSKFPSLVSAGYELEESLLEAKRLNPSKSSAEILIAMQLLNKSHVVEHHQDLFEVEKSKASIQTKEESAKRLEEYQKGFFDHLKHRAQPDVNMKVAQEWEKPIRKLIKRAQHDTIQKKWSDQAKLFAEGLAIKKKQDVMMKELQKRVKDANNNVEKKRTKNQGNIYKPNEELDTSLEDYSSHEEIEESTIKLNEKSVWVDRKHDLKKIIDQKQSAGPQIFRRDSITKSSEKLKRNNSTLQRLVEARNELQTPDFEEEEAVQTTIRVSKDLKLSKYERQIARMHSPKSRTQMLKQQELEYGHNSKSSFNSNISPLPKKNTERRKSLLPKFTLIDPNVPQNPTEALQNYKTASKIQQNTEDQRRVAIIGPEHQRVNLPREKWNSEASVPVATPMVEYMRQLIQDRIPPHLMPFRKIEKTRRLFGDELEEQNEVPEQTFKLDDLTVSVRYATSVARTLKSMQGLQALSLSNTLLTDEAFQLLLDNAPLMIKKLDISGNPNLTSKTYKLVATEFKVLESINVEKNRMQDEGVKALIQTILQKPPFPEKVKDEKGTLVPVEPLLARNQSFLTRIKVLNLSQNELGDDAAIIIAQFIKESQSIATLQLYWNKIRSRGSIAISRVLKRNTSLKILDLSFNSISSGAQTFTILDDAISETAQQKKEREALNKGISPLKDRSKSPAGAKKPSSPKKAEKGKEKGGKGKGKGKKSKKDSSPKPLPPPIVPALSLEEKKKAFKLQKQFKCSESAWKWRRTFQWNKSLLHADFSFNQLSTEDTRAIGDGLKDNHTLLGLHFENGNEAKMDQMGFIQGYENIDVINTDDKLIEQMLFSHKMHAGTSSPSRKKIQKNQAKCWLCEGWVQHKFTLKSLHFGDKKAHSVNLHLSIDGFKPMVMHEIEDDLDWELNRMIPMQHDPSAEILYFFTVEFTDREKRTISDLNAPIKFYQFDENKVEEVLGEFQAPNKVNFMNNDTLEESRNLDTEREQKPRPRDLLNAAAMADEVVEWRFETSMWASYQTDTAALLNSCFAFDWRASDIPKYLKELTNEESTQIYDYLRTQYPLIRQTYKFISGQSPAGIIPSIGMNDISQLVLTFDKQFVDYKTLKTSDIDLAFISINAVGNKKFPPNGTPEAFNPERGHIRFQLLELLTKLALDKEKKLSKAQGREYNALHAVQVLFEEHAAKNMSKFECQSWRDDRYWFEENEKILTKNAQTLMDAYKAYGKAIVVGKAKTLALPDFINMITATEIVDDSFGAREIGTIFNLSMQTQIDEINGRKHMDMSYLEFCEALARVADKAFDFVPSNYAQKTEQADEQQENKTDDERSNNASRNKSRAEAYASNHSMMEEATLAEKIDYLCFKLATLSMGPKYGNRYLKTYQDLQAALRAAGGVIEEEEVEVTTKNSTLQRLKLKKAQRETYGMQGTASKTKDTFL